MVANIVILHKFNNFTGWGEALCALMVMAYYTIYFLENLLAMFPQVHLLFDHTFIQPAVWAGLLIVCLQASVFEILFGRLELLDPADDGAYGDDYDPEKVTLIGPGDSASPLEGPEGAHQELVAVPGGPSSSAGQQPNAKAPSSTSGPSSQPNGARRATSTAAPTPGDAADEWQMN